MINQPNIVLIFSDQHRGDALGCVGNKFVRTPNLDQLAAEGVAFQNCNTSSPLCMPARASLATGQYVNEHGAWGNRNEADRFGQSHVRNVREAGYCTALFGKTHFRVPQVSNEHTRDRTFELHDWGYEVTHEIGEIPSDKSSNYYEDFLAARHKLQLHKDAMTIWKHGQGNKTLRPWEHLPSQLEEHEHIDAYLGSKAAEWIKHYDEEKPFYLQLALVGPHPPFDAPARYRDIFRPEDMPPAIMALPSEPMSPQVRTMLERRGLPNLTEGQSQLMKSHYYAKIAFDDDVIGSFVKVLREKGLMDNTWIIYTSDHGEMLGDHRLVQKVLFYEGSLNIPLIIRPPGGTSAWVGKGLTDHYDVIDTILSAANAKTFEKNHGASLIPKIQAGKGAPDAHEGKEVVFSEVNLYSMARTRNYKMAINSVTREPLELYDIENDPNELANLVNERSLSKVRNEIQEMHFNELLSDINDPQLKLAQAGGIPTSIHKNYPEY